MKRRIVPLLICPACLPDEHPLKARADEEVTDDIVEGVLTCGQCGRVYPIHRGIAFLDPASRGEKKAESRYESASVLSSYLWSHFGDLWKDPEASDAYVRWAGLMRESVGMCLDIGGAVGRFAFEMTLKSDFVIGLDNSVTFIETARDLMREGGRRVHLTEEGLLTREVPLRFPVAWDRERIEFIVGDALALPFRSSTFSALAGLNLIDKVPIPVKHFTEMNRVAVGQGAQFLFSDPFSWSKDAAGEEHWLGGKESGPYAGRGLDNVIALLNGENGELSPTWKIEDSGHVWWKIRTHCNHFELIRSRYVKAAR